MVETDKTNRKAITVAYLCAAVVTFIVVRVLFDTLGGMFSPIERYRSIELVKHAVPLGAAAIVFLILNLNPKISVWADEVVTEIRKIVWPSQRDTTVTTVAVCVMVVVAGIGLALIDYVSSVLIKWIVN